MGRVSIPPLAAFRDVDERADRVGAVADVLTAAVLAVFVASRVATTTLD